MESLPRWPAIAVHTQSSKLDGCIVWNAHNTVFGSKRTAICAQTVYYLFSTKTSVT